MSGEIYAALAKAMSAVGVVGKTRKNPQQGYQFRGVDDVVAHVLPVLSEVGVVVVPKVVEREREMIATKSGGQMASVRLLVEHHFFAKDGSSVVAVTLGEAMDSGDKASNKAMSAALKYALVETLCIPTYEADRDTEEQSPQMAAPKASPPGAKAPGDDLERAKGVARARIATAASVAEIDSVWVQLIKPLPKVDQDELTPEFTTAKRALKARETGAAS